MKKRIFPGTHIYLVEYRCQCCGKLPPDLYVKFNSGKKDLNIPYLILFQQFEAARREYGKPIPITRGYTCIKHQEFIYLSRILEYHKGLTSTEDVMTVLNDEKMTPFSEHIFGLALDLAPPKNNIPELVAILKKLKPKPRIGVYPTHIHMGHGFKISPRYSRKLREGAMW